MNEDEIKEIREALNSPDRLAEDWLRTQLGRVLDAHQPRYMQRGGSQNELDGIETFLASNPPDDIKDIAWRWSESTPFSDAGFTHPDITRLLAQIAKLVEERRILLDIQASLTRQLDALDASRFGRRD